MWKRAANYLIEVVIMGEDRWPNKCLREEVRGIMNGNLSKWGKKLKQAWESVGEGEIWGLIWEGEGSRD